jgi:hypothetical protein
LDAEITDTEAKDQHESISFTISMLRSLYLHILHAMRDRDYNSPSAYLSDLVRRDKRVNPLLSVEDQRNIRRMADNLITGKKATADLDLPKP